MTKLQMSVSHVVIRHEKRKFIIIIKISCLNRCIWLQFYLGHSIIT